MMERIHIALASDGNYRMGLLVTAASIAEHASRDVGLVFHVLDGGLSDSAWNQLTTVLQSLHSHVTLDRIPLSSIDFSQLPVYRGGTMTYARLALPSVLSAIDRCVYCDVDFLWMADVAELWREIRPDDLFCSVAEPCADTLDKEEAWCCAQGVPFHRQRYVCAGLSFYNLQKARDVKLAERTIEFLVAHPTVPFVDQTAINAVLDGDVHLLDGKWERLTVCLGKLVNLNPLTANNDVLHFAGDAPWNFGQPAAILTDAILLWHGYHARYAGITRYQSLRQCLTCWDIVRRRLYWHLVRCGLTRVAFFAALRLMGHGKCQSVMAAKCMGGLM